MNFLINCICIMILASTVEGSVGSYCTAVICIGGGIMGALFGAMAHCCNE
jgi:membrane associated rhomboid family serine protease